MAVFLSVFAGFLVALSNLCMRKAIDNGGDTKAFLVFHLFTASLISIFLEPLRSGDSEWSLTIISFGTIAGIILVVMLFSLGKALEKGPPGLTFSIISGATIMPALIMAVLFGEGLGFPYKFWHAIGSVIFLFGLFWAGKGMVGLKDLKKWLYFCLLMFALHAALLALFQYRSFSMTTNFDLKSGWFLPVMFFTAGVLQLIDLFHNLGSVEFRVLLSRVSIFFRGAISTKVYCPPKKKSKIGQNNPEIRRTLSYERDLMIYLKKRSLLNGRLAFFGIVGGMVNGMGTFLLIVATQVASSLESMILFPSYTVGTIFLSNVWGQRLYAEKVNWRACQLICVGLIVSLIDWKKMILYIAEVALPLF